MELQGLSQVHYEQMGCGNAPHPTGSCLNSTALSSLEPLKEVGDKRQHFREVARLPRSYLKIPMYDPWLLNECGHFH